MRSQRAGFVPSICRIECGDSFSKAVVENELAHQVLSHYERRQTRHPVEGMPRWYDSNDVDQMKDALVMLPAEEVMTASAGVPSTGVSSTEMTATKAFL